MQWIPSVLAQEQQTQPCLCQVSHTTSTHCCPARANPDFIFKPQPQQWKEQERWKGNYFIQNCLQRQFEIMVWLRNTSRVQKICGNHYRDLGNFALQREGFQISQLMRFEHILCAEKGQISAKKAHSTQVFRRFLSLPCSRIPKVGKCNSLEPEKGWKAGKGHLERGQRLQARRTQIFVKSVATTPWNQSELLSL